MLLSLAKKIIMALWRQPPSYEKLQGELQGAFSRRINIKYRLIYEVYENTRTVKIISLWSHYEF